MTDMNARVETLVKQLSKKGRPVVSKVKRWQDDSRRYASQNALGALRWVKSAADRAEKRIHEWDEAPSPDSSEGATNGSAEAQTDVTMNAE
jgi:hypothetical protein